MTAIAARDTLRPLHPVHAVLLAATIPLFLGALLSDIAYSNSYETHWTNFASWLIAGGLVFNGAALLWALIDLLRADHRGGQPLVYLLLLLATFVLGFINALVHAKDGGQGRSHRLPLRLGHLVRRDECRAGGASGHRA